MKPHIVIISLAMLFISFASIAQDVTTVEAANSDISDNLDLEAIASIFGEAENLEDFERKLNDPELQISNLDLNEDGQVDYLRVLETSKGNTHLITIQAVLGNDVFQDVATIDVEKDSSGETRVQVVGDVYMYGPDYIIEPVYVRPPVIFVWFWGPLYRPWHSPYYWGYYPPYYHPWSPYPPHYYRSHVHVHVNVHHTYHHTTVRRSTTTVQLHREVQRNDYARSNPDRSFSNRNEGVRNRQELNATRPSTSQSTRPSTRPTTRPATNDASNGRKVQEDWKPASERNGQNSRVKDNKVSVPTDRSRPSSQGNQNSTRPSTSDRNQGTARPSTRPEAKPEAKPQSRPQQQAKPQSRPQQQARPQSRPQQQAKPQSRPQQQAKPQASPQSKPQAAPRGGQQNSNKGNSRRR